MIEAQLPRDDEEGEQGNGPVLWCGEVKAEAYTRKERVEALMLTAY